jgi:hypothetical protein
VKTTTVKYLPEPYDCFDFEIKFPTAPEDNADIKFGFGPDEVRELVKECTNALRERRLSRTLPK